MTQPQKNKVRLICAMLLIVLLPVMGMIYGISGGFFDFILYDGLWFGLVLGCLSSAVSFWALLRGLVDWRKVKYFLLGYAFLYIVLLLCFQMNFSAYRFCGGFFACHIMLAGYLVWTVAPKKPPTPAEHTEMVQNTSTDTKVWRNFSIGYMVATLGVIVFLFVRYIYDLAESSGIAGFGVLLSLVYDAVGFFLLLLSAVILFIGCCIRSVVGILLCAAFHLVYGGLYVALLLLLHWFSPATIGAIFCLILGLATYIYYFSLPKNQRDWHKQTNETQQKKSGYQ